jgi:hypothetical protein
VKIRLYKYDVSLTNMRCRCPGPVLRDFEGHFSVESAVLLRLYRLYLAVTSGLLVSADILLSATTGVIYSFWFNQCLSNRLLFLI